MGAVARRIWSVFDSPWWMLSVFCLLYMVSIIDRQIVNLAAVSIKSDLQLTDVQLSLLLGPAFICTYVLGGLLFGVAADRFSSKWTVFTGVSIWSIAAMGSGVASSYPLLLLSRMGVGAGEASLSPVAYTAISRAIPPRRLTLATSLFVSSGAIGGALSLIIGGFLMTYGALNTDTEWPLVGTLYSWQLAFLATGAPGLLIGMLVFTYREPTRMAPVGRAGWGEALRFLATHRRLTIPAFAGFAVAAMLSYGTAAWFPSVLHRKFGLTLSQIGMILGGISAVGGLVAHVGWGAFIDRRFDRGDKCIHLKTYIGCSLLCGVPALFTLQSSSLFVFCVGLTLVYLFLNPFLGYAAALVQLITPPHLRGRVSALFIMTISGFGSGLGPVSVAFASSRIFGGEGSLPAAVAWFALVTCSTASFFFFLALQPVRKHLQETPAHASDLGTT